MEIITYPQNPRVFKSRITASLAGVAFPDDPAKFEMGKTNKTPEFYKLNPFGKVPTLKTQGGVGIFESNSMARYIARLGDAKKGGKGLYGTSPEEASRIDGFLDSVIQYEAQVGPWYYKVSDFPWTKAYTKDYVDGCIAQTTRWLEDFERALSFSPYLVGKTLTLADICFFCANIAPMKSLFDSKFLAKFPHFTKWFKKLASNKNFSSVIGKVEYCKQTPTAEFKAAQPAQRWHRLATIVRGEQKMRLKVYAESSPEGVQASIRARFGMSEDERLLLVDDEGCDVVADGTLETATYKLE